MAESDDWPLRPFDPKGSERFPVDEIIVGQIRCIITEWNPHDWSTARAILTAEITGLIDKLPTLTVRDIGQLFHGIANRGRGQRHTASMSIVSLQFPAGWTFGQPTTVQPESGPGLDKTTGYLGGEALADAMGVHPTRQVAFAQQLLRQRTNISGECWLEWLEVRDPQTRNPKFIYLADSPKLRELAADYKTPKPD